MHATALDIKVWKDERNDINIQLRQLIENEDFGGTYILEEWKKTEKWTKLSIVRRVIKKINGMMGIKSEIYRQWHYSKIYEKKQKCLPKRFRTNITTTTTTTTITIKAISYFANITLKWADTSNKVCFTRSALQEIKKYLAFSTWCK